MVYVAVLEALEMTIHPSQTAQITSGYSMKVATLKQNKAFTKISVEDSDFKNIFLAKEALVLLEYTELNKNAIKLENGKQPPHEPIYSLGPVELETLKIYIETHLKTGFIQPSKSPTGTPILFDKKLDGSLCLCVDYWGLNNLTIKNRYSLLLIGESLNRLGQTKRFTQLDLTSAYHRMRIKKGDE